MSRQTIILIVIATIVLWIVKASRDKSKMATGDNINAVPADRFTALHALAGAGLFLAGLPLWAIALVAFGFEIVEDPLKDKFGKFFPNPSHDTPINATVDAGAMIAAAALVRMATK